MDPKLVLQMLDQTCLGCSRQERERNWPGAGRGRRPEPQPELVFEHLKQTRGNQVCNQAEITHHAPVFGADVPLSGDDSWLMSKSSWSAVS